MTEYFSSLVHLKKFFKTNEIPYKVKNFCAGTFGEALHLLDTKKEIQVSGKLVNSFTEGEVYHWPLLSHENLAPLIDIIFIHNNLSVFITIDRERTLKDYVHDEDFVHDPRCYERKKSYAKGIFRGLSYLHEKSLCLMNLSDSNIAICRSTDQSIILDFSCLTCSRKTIKSKLGVSELYKAPEADKGEFDATAAEIWAAGILMLDTFLAHMVPWAIVDHKPSKVLKLVDKLSYELLKAANIGSVVSPIDLTKFKLFLRCFFKEIPMARVTARNASIASFLKPNNYDVTVGFGTLRKSKYLTGKLITKEIEKSYHPLDYVSSRASFRGLLRKTADNKVATATTSKRQIMSIPSRKESIHSLKNQNLSLPENQIPSNDMHSLPQSIKAIASQSNSQDINGQELSISQLFTEEKQDAHDIPATDISILQETNKSNGLKPIAANSNVQKFPECYPVISQEKYRFPGSSYCSHQSNSLPVLKLKDAEKYNFVSFRTQLSLSLIGVKSSPIPPNTVFHNSDLCLNLPLKDVESNKDVKSSNQATETIPKKAFKSSDQSLNLPLNDVEPSTVIKISNQTANTNSKKDFQSSDQRLSLPLRYVQSSDETKCSNQKTKSILKATHAFHVNFQEKRMLESVHHKERISHTVDDTKAPKPGLEKLNGNITQCPTRDIVRNLITLTQCEKSLQYHPQLHGPELIKRQQEMLKDYQKLLHEEKALLYNCLKKEYGLTRQEVLDMTKEIMQSEHTDKPLKIAPKVQCRKNTTGTQTFDMIKNYSYRRATENSENSFAKNMVPNIQQKELVLSDSFKSTDTLIENCRSKSKHGKKKCNRKSYEEVSNGTGNCKMCKSTKRSKEKNTGRSFCFPLRPGRRVEEPSLKPENLCETCKLKLEIT